MEELKILLSALKDLPQMAIWVILMYFIFKVVVVGSIFGVIRYVTLKIHDWAKTRKESKLVTVETTREVIKVKQINFGQHYISDVKEPAYQFFNKLNESLRRDDGYKYVHRSDLRELEDFYKVWIEKKGNKDES